MIPRPQPRGRFYSLSPRNGKLTVESFLLAPTVLQGIDLITLVLERAVPLLRRTAAIRLLEPPAASADHPDAVVEPAPHRTTDPALTWVRAKIGEIAANLNAPDA